MKPQGHMDCERIIVTEKHSSRCKLKLVPQNCGEGYTSPSQPPQKNKDYFLI